jgi:hypothetical protein
VRFISKKTDFVLVMPLSPFGDTRQVGASYRPLADTSAQRHFGAYRR